MRSGKEPATPELGAAELLRAADVRCAGSRPSPLPAGAASKETPMESPREALDFQPRRLLGVVEVDVAGEAVAAARRGSHAPGRADAGTVPARAPAGHWGL